MNWMQKFYENKYKLLLIFPFLILLAAFIQIEEKMSATFQDEEITIRNIHSAGKIIAVAIDTNLEEEQKIANVRDFLETETGLSATDFNIEVVGSSLGESFFRQTATALLIGFLLMGLVVFIYFKTLVPSLAVVLAAFSDIVVTLAI